ncbi:putative phosphatidate phosphatase [Orussus abietinus]|uniref:putative phosphatidate phosphatase n=1 Tax=Orussus abietinus TaxID=222816 RepID=UPI0006256921|nr:putative phosphatidate phosphatase [Orussus abietinus]
MDRSTRSILTRIVVDFLCVFIVGLCVLVFFLFGRPNQRGFFCNDESLYHPFRSSTVTSTNLYVTGMILPICLMILGEYVHTRKSGDQSSRILFGYSMPSWAWKAYTKIGIFGFGAATTVLFTDIAKYTIGRLRPHFMTVCVPNVDCNLLENQHRYIEDFTCTSNFSTKLLKEVRLSFPSGHSSFSAYTMLYVALYLQLRFTWEGSKLLKHVLQIICLLMAWFTAMSRVTDYKHHWSDVLAGSTLGVVVAVLMAYCVADLFRERSPLSPGDKLHSGDYEVEGGTQGESCPLRRCLHMYGDMSSRPPETT